MLRKTLGDLLKMTASYSLNSLVAPLFTIILTPVYAKILDPADYGGADTLLMLGSIISIVGTLGLTTALPVLYYEVEDEIQKQRLLASTFWTALLWSALVTGIVLAAAWPISQLALGTTTFTTLIWVLAIGQPGNVVYAIQSTVLRLRFAIWRANILAMCYLLTFVGSNLLFIVVLRWGAAGIITAHTLTNIVIAIAAMVIGSESLRRLPHPRLMARLARLGLPILPAGLALWILLWEDRLFLVRTVSFAEIGVYSIANKLSSMLLLLVIPFRSAWEPLALSIQKHEGAARTYAKILTYYTVLSLGLALIISLFAREILLVFATPEYVGAARYVWLLVFTPLTSGFQAIVVVGLLIEKRLSRLGWAIIVAAAINTLFNALLIPMLGVLGAAIATSLGYLSIALIVARAAQRTRPFPFQWNKILIVLLVYLVLAGTGVLLSDRTDLISVSLRGALLAAYLPLLWALQIFEAHEVKLATRILREPARYLRRMAGAR